MDGRTPRRGTELSTELIFLLLIFGIKNVSCQSLPPLPLQKYQPWLIGYVRTWRPGSQLAPWLRDNADRLTRLNREERFSWAAVAAALNEVGIVYRTGNPWTATNLAKAVSEFRYGGRGNPSAEHRAVLAEWKSKHNAEKADEDAAFAAAWEEMPSQEQDELIDLWRETEELFGTAAGRFLSRMGYRKARPKEN